MKSPLLLLLCCLVLASLCGQPTIYSRRTLSIAEGLPNSTVHDLAQDSVGHIWAATFHGIARYDGLRFRNYYPARALDTLPSSNDRCQLHVGPSGRLWLGYLNKATKIMRYEAARDTFLPLAPRAPRSWQPIEFGVADLYEADNELWVATTDDGLLRFDLRDDPTTDTLAYRQYLPRPDDSTALPSKHLKSGMVRDRRGRLWLLTETGDLVSYRPDRDDFATYRWSESEQYDFTGTRILPDPTHGCLWFGSSQALLRFDLETFTFQAYRIPGQAKHFTAVHSQEKSGVLWLSIHGHPNSQLWSFDPRTEAFQPALARTGTGVDTLDGHFSSLYDRHGNLWTGNFYRGMDLMQLRPDNVRRVRLPATDPAFRAEAITACAERDPAELWLGTTGQGLWCWDRRRQRLTQAFVPRRAGTAEVAPITSLAMSPDGDELWIFTPKQVYRRTLATGATRSFNFFPPPLLPKAEYSYALIWEGELWGQCGWVGSFHAPLSDPTAVERWLSNDPEAPVAYDGFLKQAPGREAGQLWLPHVYRGLWEWNANTRDLRNYLGGMRLWQVWPAPDRLIWIASPTGLHCFDPRTEELLPLDSIPAADRAFPLALVADAAGLLWYGTPDGIVAIDPATRRTVHRLYASSWLPDARDWYNDGPVATDHPDRGLYSFRSASGELFFANNAGFFVLDPARIHYDSIPPPVALQEFLVNNDRQALPATGTEEIVLEYGKNDLRFELAALHYKLPTENRLHYFLEGFDSDWRTAAAGQAIEYPNLPPATYRLLAKATNSDGYTGTARLVATLRLRPSWYANPYAYTAYGLASLLLLFGFFRLEVRRRDQAARRRYLEELDTAKTHLFTNISHELRTPLTLILGDARALRERVGDGLREQTERIYRGGERLLWLVNQLLELAQADSNFLRLEPRRADIIPFLRYNLRAFESLTDQRGIELRFRTSVPACPMDFDPERLQRVISNVIDNAIKFSPDGGNIDLAVDLSANGAPEPRLRIAITDEGPGLSAAELPLVFDRFHRANDARGGTGIGLALAKELVELMDGSIAVQSEPGEGATFLIELPVRTEAPPAEPGWMPVAPALAVASAEAVHPTDLTTAEIPRVLIVEDNADLRTFLRECLQDTYRITLARDGVAGLELARAEDFELIISDVMMPRMDGFTLCRQLKEDPGTSHLPVILLTARVDTDSRLEGFSRGADAYLPKPFDPRELRVRCAQLLEQRDRLRGYYQQLIRNEAEEDAPAEPMSLLATEERAFIIRARQFVVDNLGDEDFGVDQLAAALAISRSQLHRKLTQLADVSTTGFIQEVRLSHARELLRDPSLSIAEVAYDCGFGTPDYFTRVFKKKYGDTPTGFRRGLEES